MTTSPWDDPYVDPLSERALVAAWIGMPTPAEWGVIPEDFAHPALRALWRAVLSAADIGLPADLGAVFSALERAGDHHIVTDEVIASLADAVPISDRRRLRALADRVIALSRRRAVREALRTAAADATEDDADLAAERATSLLRAATGSRGIEPGVCARDGIVAAVESLRAGAGGRWHGLSTGIPTLDDALGGLAAGELAVVSGITGGGKTTLAIQIADTIASHPTDPADVLYCSGEMLAGDLWLRILCSRGRLSLADMRRGCTASHWQSLITAADRAASSRLRILDNDLSLARIETAIHRFAADHPRALIVVDHLDHVEVGGRVESQVVAIATIMRRLKAAALAAKVPMLLVAQFNRGFEGDRRPGLHDLKGGSAIEQYADSVWLLHHPDDEAPRWATLAVAKNRRGPRADCHLDHDLEHTRFSERQGEQRTWTTTKQTPSHKPSSA